MFAALAAGASHPAVAAWLGLGAAGLAAVVVAMAWSVNARQIRLAEQLARRQFLITSGAGAGVTRTRTARPRSRAPGRRRARRGQAGAAGGHRGTRRGDHGRAGQVPGAAVGPAPGGDVGGRRRRGLACADPAHPDDLLLIADRPGDLTIIARVREGLTERRATKSVTAAPEVTLPAPPFTLRLFLHGWGLVVVAVLIVGFAGALDALGNFTSSDFIALAVPLAALLGVIAVARGASEAGGRPAAAMKWDGAGKRHGQL